ncbi:hypothetical protein N7457_006361 [Penicillium paradoxum]|uniref:uncharacterized protein n=1 Tax=Penicillium paradoxum TaxID=176176 RepID=UPI0025485AE8|nr:uncharacterized protein N7457_006361 [Penicillium paradoxum]KAJ5781201.1 hypothetical protein N7457_006361 [Penicillium paradoxum]
MVSIRRPTPPFLTTSCERPVQNFTERKPEQAERHVERNSGETIAVDAPPLHHASGSPPAALQPVII